MVDGSLMCWSSILRLVHVVPIASGATSVLILTTKEVGVLVKHI